MAPDDELPEDEEIGRYEPIPAGLSDGDVLIFDPVDFEAAFNCYGLQLRENQLFVLCKETRRWVPAEGRGQEPKKPSGQLTRVK